MRKLGFLLAIIITCTCFSGCKKQEGDALSSSYEISLEYFENGTASVKQTVNVKNNQELSISSLYFTLYPLAFSKDAQLKPYTDENAPYLFPHGKSYGDINLSSVHVNNDIADYVIEDITLKVGLSAPLKNGDSASVHFEYFLTLPNANHRYGYGDNTVNLSGFYPVLCVFEKGKFYTPNYYPVGDPFYSTASNFKVNLTVPSTYVVAPSLRVESVIWEGEKTTYVMERNRARDVALILSKNYSVAKQRAGEIDVSYYYFNDKEPEKTLQIAVESLNYYQKSFGNYGYGEYVVCEADFLYGGMEYSGLSLISASLGDRAYVVAHETAHQWWRGIVGFNECEIAFLDEGLTEFSAVSFCSNAGINEYANYLTSATKQYGAIRRALVEEGVVAPPVMVRNLGEFSTELEYVNVSYKRSLIAIDELKNHVGDARFFKALRAFCKDFSYRNATYNDFLKAMDKAKPKSREILLDYTGGVAVVK